MLWIYVTVDMIGDTDKMKRWRQPRKIEFSHIHKKMMNVGSWLGCHQIPERSFHIYGYQFPLCARCTGIGVGYIIGPLMLIWERIPMQMCIVYAGIMFADWYMQYINVLPSTNLRRLITGVFCGVGYVHFWANIIVFMFHWIEIS